MKNILLILFLLIGSIVFSQTRWISGIVKDETTLPLPGVMVSVKNSSIETTTNFDGIFSIQVPDSLNILVFRYVGLLSKEYELGPNDKNVQVVLKSSYDIYWNTIGINVDPVNSVYGLVYSNGFDEVSLVPFESFSQTLIYKISGQTDFNHSYSFDAKLGVRWPIRELSFAHIGYTNMYFKDDDFNFQDVYLSISRYINSTSAIFKTGFQQLKEEKNVGFNLGVQQELKNFYAGGTAGYYFDYFDFSGYLQYGFVNDNICSVRLEYRRVDKTDFLSLGFHFTFSEYMN